MAGGELRGPVTTHCEGWGCVSVPIVDDAGWPPLNRITNHALQRMVNRINGISFWEYPQTNEDGAERWIVSPCCAMLLLILL